MAAAAAKDGPVEVEYVTSHGLGDGVDENDSVYGEYIKLFNRVLQPTNIQLLISTAFTFIEPAHRRLQPKRTVFTRCLRFVNAASS